MCVCVYEGKKGKKRGLEAAGVKFRPLPSVYKVKVVFSVSVVLSTGVQVQVESVLKMFSNHLKVSCESPKKLLPLKGKVGAWIKRLNSN